MLSIDKPPFAPESLPRVQLQEQKQPEPELPVSKKWWQFWKPAETTDERTLRSLFVDLASEDSQRVSTAYRALIKIGTPAIGGCVTFFKSFPDEYGCKLVADILGEIGTAKAVEPLTMLAEHPKIVVRLSAARSLSQIADVTATGALKEMLGHTTSDVRENAVTALNRIEARLRKQ